jgi:hypothetical protein
VSEAAGAASAPYEDHTVACHLVTPESVPDATIETGRHH